MNLWIVLRILSQKMLSDVLLMCPIDNKLTLIQVMTPCHKEMSHDLYQFRLWDFLQIIASLVSNEFILPPPPPPPPPHTHTHTHTTKSLRGILVTLRPSVRPSVAFSSSNFRRCVVCKISKFGNFLKFVTLTLSSFDLGPDVHLRTQAF